MTPLDLHRVQSPCQGAVQVRGPLDTVFEAWNSFADVAEPGFKLWNKLTVNFGLPVAEIFSKAVSLKRSMLACQ